MLFEDFKYISQEVLVMQFVLFKFKIFCGFEVFEVLQFLGLVLLFGEDVDFMEMVDFFLVDKFYVLNMYYKMFVEVNEKGMEVVVVMVVIVILRGLFMFQNFIDFVCDYFFLFVIKEELMNVIIFIGCIIDFFVEKQSFCRVQMYYIFQEFIKVVFWCCQL